MSAVLSGALPHLRDMQETDVPAVLAIERVAYDADAVAREVVAAGLPSEYGEKLLTAA